jgi:hypothetical protein
MAIDYPNSPTLGQVYTYGSRTWTWTGVAWQATATSTGPQGIQGVQGIQGPNSAIAEIQILDDLFGKFDDSETVFSPTYQGALVPITNPFTLQVYLNGLSQKVTNSSVVWDSPVVQPNQVRVNDDGNIAFSTTVPSGTIFEGKVLVGSATTALTTTYPFAAMDLLMGAF